MVKHELYQAIRGDLVRANNMITILEEQAFAHMEKPEEMRNIDGSYPYLNALQTRSNLLLAMSNLEKK